MLTGTENRYTTIPRTLCFVLSASSAHLGGQDHVLLLKGNERKWFAGLYNGVGGHVEADEDVFSAALREIREETSLEVHDLRLELIVNEKVEERRGVMLFVFTCLAVRPVRQACLAAAAGQTAHPAATNTPDSSTLLPGIQSGREGELHWIPLAELDSYPLVHDVRELLHLLVREPVGGERPLFAHYELVDGKQVRITYATPADHHSTTTGS